MNVSYWSITTHTHTHNPEEMPFTEHEMDHGGKTYTIYCGKDAKSNDELLDESDPDDIWFHVANHSSGHVILKNEEKSTVKKIPRQVIKRCACICKATIRAQGKCEIIYTERRNIAKTDVIGCVTTTNLKTVTV